ncbi:helix-turn-helix transcriptional regulator [Roseovarius sp. CAU 1744]|uniref:helix-turn-helix domain-containing protein n=1 Tax=Roseovarius sp. CAU 1744 TaxID=3140368 RepID=UPI00325BEBA4
MTVENSEHWYDPQATTFGDRVAGAREQTGMSQADLAKRLGIKVKTLVSWENDVSEPRANKLSMMAGLLNVSLRWLLTGEGDGPTDEGADSRLVMNAAAALSEIHDVRAQLAASSARLARLEESLRDMREAVPVD